MKLLIFTEGTILMHKSGKNCTRKQRVKQVKEREKSVFDYNSYIPIGKAENILNRWQKQGIKIIYLTSRTKPVEIKQIKRILAKYKFPKGKLAFRKKGQKYKDVAEKQLPDILIEDDCESIGGKKQMTYTYINPQIKKKIKLISVKEFRGIDHLSNVLV